MGQFALDIARFVDKARGNADIVVRKVGFEVFRRVVLKTPVDTGRARANWMCSVSEMAVSVSDAQDKRGSATIMGIAETLNEVKAGSIFYLTNSLPYILPLEQGSSKQAPAGMVATTLREFPGIVETAADEVR